MKLWSFTSPIEPVHTLSSGHNDVVREFLWRAKGGNDPLDDDREFQLVTWGSDRQLLLTPVTHTTTSLVGHVPHSPIEVRQTRRHAGNRSFRDLLPSPSQVLAGASPVSIMNDGRLSPSIMSHAGKPLLRRHNDSSSGASHSAGGGESKMTPPQALHSSSSRLPLSAAANSRYGWSSNTGTTGSQSSSGDSPQYGVSLADSKGLHLANAIEMRAGTGGSSQQEAPNSPVAEVIQPKHGVFMTRNTNRRPGVQDTVSWMENVRIVSASGAPTRGPRVHGIVDLDQDHDASERQRHGGTGTFSGTSNSVREKVTLPLHEEITATARAFENRVRFEKVS